MRVAWVNFVDGASLAARKAKEPATRAGSSISQLRCYAADLGGRSNTAAVLHAPAIAPRQRAMTSILADFGVWLGGDGLIRGAAALQVLEPPSHATPLRMCATIASMRSAIADALSAEDRARFVALSPAQRANLQLRLGREATRAYAALHGLSFEEARDRLDALGRIGRRPCAWQR